MQDDGLTGTPARSFRGDDWSSRDVEQLALHEPDEYRKLLDGYYLLLGERLLWWQRSAEHEDPRWRDCVRSAIVSVAQRSQTSASWLADFLDGSGAPATRDRVLRIAKSRFYSQAAA